MKVVNARGQSLMQAMEYLDKYRDDIVQSDQLLLGYRKMKRHIRQFEDLRGLSFDSINVSHSADNVKDATMAKYLSYKKSKDEIDEVIASLKDGEKELLKLHYLGDREYTPREICSMAGITGNQFYDLLTETLVSFAKRYKKYA